MTSNKKWTWWNDVLSALNGEAELTYRPEWQDVPAGMFDTHSHTVKMQPAWTGRNVTIESFVDDDTMSAHQAVTVSKNTNALDAADAIRSAWM